MTSYLPNPSISYWPADTSIPVINSTVGDILRKTSQEHPNTIALIEYMPEGYHSLTGASSTNRRWTYEQLLAEAEQCAFWLLEHCEPGEKICVWAPNIPEWIILQYGAALAGLILVTANPSFKADELRYVLKQSDSVAIFYTDNFRGTDMQSIVDTVSGDLRFTFCFKDWHNKIKSYAKKHTLPLVSPQDPTQIQYTSGTTGQPKGALLHHMGIVTNASLTAQRMGLKQHKLISAMPLFHTAGCVLNVLCCCTTASTSVLPLLFDPKLVLQAIDQEKINFLSGVPTMMIALLEHPELQSYNLKSLKAAISGGSPVPGELLYRIEKGFGCDLLEVYGQTETSPILCQTSPSDSVEDKTSTAGKPLPQVEIRIANINTDQTTPTREEGEIQARGYQLMLEYYQMPEATKNTIDQNGWLRTGDLGIMDQRGYITVTGRLKDMIIRGGENIYPVELENHIISHPAVSDVAIFGYPDTKWGEIVCAALQLKDKSLPISALHDYCRQGIAPHKTPSRWFLCENYPLTASGKIQKFRLREMLTNGQMEELYL